MVRFLIQVRPQWWHVIRTGHVRIYRKYQTRAKCFGFLLYVVAMAIVRLTCVKYRRKSKTNTCWTHSRVMFNHIFCIRSEHKNYKNESFCFGQSSSFVYKYYVSVRGRYFCYLNLLYELTRDLYVNYDNNTMTITSTASSGRSNRCGHTNPSASAQFFSGRIGIKRN